MPRESLVKLSVRLRRSASRPTVAGVLDLAEPALVDVRVDVLAVRVFVLADDRDVVAVREAELLLGFREGGRSCKDGVVETAPSASSRASPRAPAGAPLPPPAIEAEPKSSLRLLRL